MKTLCIFLIFINFILTDELDIKEQLKAVEQIKIELEQLKQELKSNELQLRDKEFELKDWELDIKLWKIEQQKRWFIGGEFFREQNVERTSLKLGYNIDWKWVIGISMWDDFQHYGIWILYNF